MRTKEELKALSKEELTKLAFKQQTEYYEILAQNLILIEEKSKNEEQEAALYKAFEPYYNEGQRIQQGKGIFKKLRTFFYYASIVSIIAAYFEEKKKTNSKLS